MFIWTPRNSSPISVAISVITLHYISNSADPYSQNLPCSLPFNLHTFPIFSVPVLSFSPIPSFSPFSTSVLYL